MADNNLPEWAAGIRLIGVAAEDAMQETVAKAGMLIVRKAQGNFEGAHRAGEPHVGGDKPNIVSGDLRRSIRADPLKRYGRGDYGTYVGPRMVYGRRVELEYGYTYFEPAVRAAEPQYESIARAAWQKHLNR